MGLFSRKKKKTDEELAEDSLEASDDEYPNDYPEVPVAEPLQNSQMSGDASIGKIQADVEKLKAQFSTFYEIQKTTSERFSIVNQQIGELRSMMIERDKTSQHLEAKASQAIDLVRTVQPDKLMIEIRKGDSKVEALRANIESNENIVKNVLKELKDVKNKIAIFRGMEQVINLNEESKKELLDIKKMQAIVERHTDKVETIFTEMQKKFADFIRFSDNVNDLEKSFKQISTDFDSMKIKATELANKKEVENLISKFDDFEKYSGNILKLINGKFEKLQKDLNDDFSKKFEESDKLLKGFQTLALKTPDLDKYFNLLEEEAKKITQPPSKVEKIKSLGEEAKQPLASSDGRGVMDKVSGIVGKFKRK
jgi:phage shock protein A